MIIRIDREIYSFRYLPRKMRHSISLFFVGANVAFRKGVLKEKYFDESLLAGEDVDIGKRFSDVGELFSNPRAVVTHSSTLSFRHILKQWWLIANYQIKVVAKSGLHGMEVFVTSYDQEKENYFRCVYYREGPLKAIVFLSSFLFMNVFAFLSILFSLLAWTVPLGGALFCFFVCLLIYLRKEAKLKNVGFCKRLGLASLRFAINTILLYISFISGLKERILYINCEFS